MVDSQVKTFYKMKLQAGENGLEVITEEFISIHESQCFHYCINKTRECQMNIYLNRLKGTPLQIARQGKIKVHRIDKTSSRFAYDTKQKAFENLRFLKKKQLGHMERETAFIEVFLIEAKGVESLRHSGYSSMVKNTEDLVNAYLNFEF